MNYSGRLGPSPKDDAKMPPPMTVSSSSSLLNFCGAVIGCSHIGVQPMARRSSSPQRFLRSIYDSRGKLILHENNLLLYVGSEK